MDFQFISDRYSADGVYSMFIYKGIHLIAVLQFKKIYNFGEIQQGVVLHNNFSNFTILKFEIVLHNTFSRLTILEDSIIPCPI